MSKNFIPSRRDLLKSGGALVVSFSFFGRPGETLAQAAAAAKPVALTAVDTFLAIDAAGMVTVYSGKVDLGTGVRTALAQIVADELDVPFNRVEIVQGDTALTPDQGPTFGSLSIQIGGVQIRNAAAMARSALLDLAATQLGVKPEELTVSAGTISGGGKTVSYGDLIGGKAFSLAVDHTKPPKTKDAKDFKIVGTSVPRVDIPDKVTGKFTYMQDFRVPGMLHGRVIRPPAIGATLQSVDESSISGIAGVVKLVREGNFLGVVAENEWAAIKAAQQLKATLVELGGAARAGQADGARPRHQGGQGRCDRKCRQRSGGDEQRRREKNRRHLRLRHPYPRLDRAVLRDRRIQGRQAHIVVGIASHPQSAQAARQDASACRWRACAASTSRAPAATAATATRMRPPTRRCWRRR